MKLCYSDFTYTIRDYFEIIKKRELVYEFIIPIIMSVLFYTFIFQLIPIKGISGYVTNFMSLLVNVFAILVGFTITAIAIFTSVDHKKIELLSKMNERKISGKCVTNYRFIYVNLIYSAFASIVMLIFTLSSFILMLLIQERVLLALLIAGTLHVLLLSLRNVTTIYFTFANIKQSD